MKDPSALIKSLSTNPAFLRNKATDSKQVVDYKDWQITLSRRFRAMKLWLVLRSYGVANLRCFLRSHVKMAKLFEELVRLDNRFEVVAPENFLWSALGFCLCQMLKKIMRMVWLTMMRRL